MFITAEWKRWADSIIMEAGGKPVLSRKLLYAIPQFFPVDYLTPRAERALPRRGVLYVGDLATHTQQSVLGSGVGKDSAALALQTILKPLNLTYGMDIPNWPGEGHPLRPKLVERYAIEAEMQAKAKQAYIRRRENGQPEPKNADPYAEYDLRRSQDKQERRAASLEREWPKLPEELRPAARKMYGEMTKAGDELVDHSSYPSRRQYVAAKILEAAKNSR